MKNYKVCGEGPHHIDVLHQDGTVMKIAKHHLDIKMMVKLAQMPRVEHKAGGGDVDPADPSTASLFGGMVDSAKGMIPDTSGMPQSQPGSEMPAPGPADAPPPPGVQLDNSPMASQGPGTAAPVGQQTFPTPTGAPPAQPGMPQAQGGDNPYAESNSRTQGDLGAFRQANIDKATAEGKASDAAAKVYADTADKMQKAEADRQTQLRAVDDEQQKIKDSIISNKIDPNHYWNSQETSTKIGMLAGIVLSGIGSGLSGQQNLAMQVMQKNIDRDVEAQQANLGSKKTLLEANLKRYGNIDQAAAATRLNLLSVTQAQISAAAAQQGSAQAMANAKMANAQLDMQYGVPVMQNMAKFRAGMENIGGTNANTGGGYSGPGVPAGGGGSESGGYDLNKLSKMQYRESSGIPTGFNQGDFDQAKKESDAHANARAGLDNIMSQWDTMEQHKGSVMTSMPQSTPGVMTDQNSKLYNAAKAAAQAEGAKGLGEKASLGLIAEGEPFLPAAGDDKATSQYKRAQFVNIYKKTALKEAGGYATSRRMGLISPADPLINLTPVPQLGK